MQVEDNSTRCPECLKPLFWLGHNMRRREGGDTEVFSFGCDGCKREYLYLDGQLTEKKRERDTHAESTAIIESELDAALSHRCPACGGPISDGSAGPRFACLWCGETYSVEKGELIPRLKDLLRSARPKMGDFYAPNNQR